MARKRKAVARKRKNAPGQGRKSLFPGNRSQGRKVSFWLSQVAFAAIAAAVEALTARKPRIDAADDVEVVTMSNAAEYLIRKGAGIPLED